MFADASVKYTGSIMGSWTITRITEPEMPLWLGRGSTLVGLAALG